MANRVIADRRGGRKGSLALGVRAPLGATTGLFLFTLVVVVCSTGSAQDLLEGAALRTRLNTEVGIVWRANPLRKALTNLSASQKVAILLDRRQDPELPVDFSAQAATLRSALDDFARQHDLGVGLVDSVVYVGPPATADVVATVAELRRRDAMGLPDDRRALVLRKAAMQWPDLATPKQLLDGLAEEAGIEMVNLSQVPHDLWPATTLPRLAWTDRMTLLLAGFHCTFRFSDDGRTVRLVRIADRPVVQDTVSGHRVAPELLDRLAGEFPRTKFENTSAGLRATGRVEDLNDLRRRLRGDAPVAPVRGELRYTLTVVNKPVGGIVAALTNRWNLELRYDEAVTGQMKERLVSFSVRDVTRDQLLGEVLEPAGLDFRIRDDTMNVFPRAR